MRCEFLGTGTSFGTPVIGCDCQVCRSTDPHDQRLRASLWVVHQDVSLIVDTSPDFRQQCLRAQIRHVDAVLYTHLHADHCFGLDDIRIYARGRNLPIYLADSMWGAFTGMFGYTLDHRADGTTKPKLALHSLALQPLQFGALRVEPVTVMHGALEIMGFVFSAGGARLAYLTDCKALPPASIAAIENVDILILGAIWCRDRQHPGHLNLAEALALAETLRAGRCYFTHMSHDIGLHRETSLPLPPTAALAHDGLVINVT